MGRDGRTVRIGTRAGAWMGALFAAVATGCAEGAWEGEWPDARAAAEAGAEAGGGPGPVADVVFDLGPKDAGAGDATAADAAGADPGAADPGGADPWATPDGDGDAGGGGGDDAHAGDTPHDTRDTGHPDDGRDDGGPDGPGPADEPFETLCQPCLEDADCTPAGGPDGRHRACMDLGDAGNYCGVACADDGDCPADYRCLVAPGVLPVARACVPRSLRCPCTDRFVLGAFRTRCAVTSPHGTCTAERTCDQACPAPTPARETCNGRDDDCDGWTDEATATECFPGRCDGTCRTSCTRDGDCGSGACCGGTCRDLHGDRSHCGSCATACRNDHGTTACRDGTCRPACDDGFGDCDALRSNGCEASLSTAADCGACGAPCVLPGGLASCATGTCELAACDFGRASCDGDAANGCETDLAGTGNTCDTAEWVGAACGDQACGMTCGGAAWRSMALRSGRGGRWFRATLHECSGCCADLRARIVLEGPPGVDYDLFVHGACGVLLGSSTRGPGLPDEVVVGRDDGCTGGDSGFDVRVEVRLHGGATCAPWTLSIDGTTCD